MADNSSADDWPKKLDTLGLTPEEAGKARLLLLTRTAGERRVILADPLATAAAAVRALLEQELEKQRQHQRQLLDGLGILSEEFLDHELDGLVREGYTDVKALRSASREGLEKAGLRAARIDEVFISRGAAAWPGSGSTAAAGVDNSREYARQLLQPPLDSPPHLDDLQRFIQGPPAAQIPITMGALDAIRLPSALQPHFTTARGHLARAVALSLTMPLTLGDSEMWTVLAAHIVVVSLLLALDKALPPDLRIGLVAERGQRDSTSLMTVKALGGTTLRPDGVLRENSGRRLLAKWEDKAADMDQAVKDLQKTTAAWTPLYYGDIEYLPCFAAAGSHLQFYAISHASGMATAPLAISSRFDLTDADDRIAAVMATIKFYQLLCAQRARYSADVLPAGTVLCAQGQEFTRELLFRTDVLAVRKRVWPWPAFASRCGVDFTRLEELYRATAQRQGLVHAVGAVPTLQDSIVYSVDIIPVGLQSDNTLPATEDDARRLMHGLLHGLAAIHEAGFVHRDLRWDNFACSPGHPSSRRWFLLDLETCAPANQPPPPAFEPVGWQSGTTLVDGRYTRASDLYQLGMAVQPNCERVVVSAEGKAFMEAILTPPASQECSAEQLLQHEWLGCEGASICRAAGAWPGER